MNRSISLCACAIALCGCSTTSATNNPDSGTNPGSDGGQCVLYQVPAGSNLNAPPVSFKNDVLPIFQGSCGLSSSCHGDPHGAHIFLGSATNADPNAILAGIVNQKSTEDPAMNFITPGQPNNSFLMHKIDWDSCFFAPECVGTGDPSKPPCGDNMPDQSAILPISYRDTIRRWIAQNAQNN